METIPYLEFLKVDLLGLEQLGTSVYRPLSAQDVSWKGKLLLGLTRPTLGDDLTICRSSREDVEARLDGRDWPATALTMIGRARLENLEHCVRACLEDEVPGDLIETGVWRGGAVIFMRAILSAYQDTTRSVWVADSFAGLPKPSPELYPDDLGDGHHLAPELAVPLDVVQANFSRYFLLDDQVKFLEGWFKDTLPQAPIQSLAVLRLDGDMYESTLDALTSLYPKLSPGGFCIIDDWGAVPACRQAVIDYRSEHGISEPIHDIDWTGVYWRKSG
jgi:O-methyltransferase